MPEKPRSDFRVSPPPQPFNITRLSSGPSNPVFILKSTQPASGQPTPRSKPHDKPGKRPKEVARPGVETSPSPGAPDPARRAGRTLPSSRLRPSLLNSISSQDSESGSETPSPESPSALSWTAAAEDQTSRASKAPPLPCLESPPMSNAPGSARLRPESYHRSSANPERVQKRVSAKGTTTQLAGGKLGDIGEDRNRKDPKRSSKGGRRYWRCSGREFREGCDKFSRVSRKIKKDPKLWLDLGRKR
ncbi:hypothetical protein J1605_014330 [Eschrichtius robustus]|uniref:Uncharacterized protein n=1 Tax=Eschrichtius robustus TaxID=9764 RepID=A0AB34GCE3_ESCRO|nr:hypothetical protein J1605_014330 [Eschrichtius robustus]